MKTGSFSWGSPHRFDFTEDEAGHLTGVLRIEKANGRQNIDVAFPHSVRLLDVLLSWHDQGQRWMELFVHDDRPFVAMRVIWLRDNLAVRWDVLHIDEKPFDSCVVLNMRKEDWPFGTFRVERIRA